MTKYKCGDCGRKTGQLHLDGCDIERCPKCKGQLLSCGCKFPYMSKDEKYLFDKKEKAYKRFLVQRSNNEDFNIAKTEKEIRVELIQRLQELYGNNRLNDKDEITILDVIEFLGSEDDLNW